MEAMLSAGSAEVLRRFEAGRDGGEAHGLKLPRGCTWQWSHAEQLRPPFCLVLPACEEEKEELEEDEEAKDQQALSRTFGLKMRFVGQ